MSTAPQRPGRKDAWRAGDGAAEGVSIFALLTILLRERWLLLGMMVVGLVSGFGFAVLSAKAEYVAEARFTPQTSSPPPATSEGLTAALFSALNTAEGESIPFYLALLQSRVLLDDVAERTFRFARTPDPASDTLEGNIYELFRLGEPSDIEARRAAVNKLAGMITAGHSRETGMFILRTKAEWPGLALQLNQALLDGINEFNVRRRQARASIEREYVQGRVAEAEARLAEAEEELERFLVRNRRIQESPELSLTLARLERQIKLRQELYIALVQSLDQLRAAEAKAIPVINVLEPPALLDPSDRTQPLEYGLFVMAIGLVLGIFLALLFEYLRQQPLSNPEDYQEYRALLRRLRPRGAAPRVDRQPGERTSGTAGVA